MSVDADTVRRVAHLARIAVAEDEVESLRGELNAILAFVEQLAEVNVEAVEPMTSVTPMAMKMREDKVTDGGIADAIIANAPAHEHHFFPSVRKWWNDAQSTSFHHPRASVARAEDLEPKVKDLT